MKQNASNFSWGLLALSLGKGVYFFFDFLDLLDELDLLDLLDFLDLLEPFYREEPISPRAVAQYEKKHPARQRVRNKLTDTNSESEW